MILPGTYHPVLVTNAFTREKHLICPHCSALVKFETFESMPHYCAFCKKDMFGSLLSLTFQYPHLQYPQAKAYQSFEDFKRRRQTDVNTQMLLIFIGMVVIVMCIMASS